MFFSSNDCSQNCLLHFLRNCPEIVHEVVTKILFFIDHQIVPRNFPKSIPKIPLKIGLEITKLTSKLTTKLSFTKYWAYAIHIPIFTLHVVTVSDSNLPKDPSDLRCASIILCLDSRRMGFNCFKFKCCITNCETCKWRPYFLQLVYLTCVKLYHFLCKLY